MEWEMGQVIWYTLALPIILRVILRSKKDIVDTSETDALRILSLALMLSWALPVLPYIILTIYIVKSGLDLFKLVGALVILLPIVSAIISYVGLNKNYQKRIKAEPLPEHKDWLRIQEIVWSVSSELQITPPRVTCSERIATPVVYGKKANSCTFALPRTFFQVIELATSSIQDRMDEYREALERYIISHELSHIKHRDVPFKSIMGSIHEKGRYFAVLAFIVSVLFAVLRIGTHYGFPIVPFMLFLFLISYCAFYACFKLSSKHGEYLADARARLMLHNSPIWNSAEGNNAPLISLLESVKYQEKLIPNAKANLRGGLWEWVRSHPDSVDRERAFGQVRYISEDRATIMNWSAIIVGLWSSLIIIMGEILLFYLDYDSQIGGLIPSIGVSGPVTIILFLYPIKNAINYARNDTRSFVRMLIMKSLLATLSFIVTFLLVASYISIWAILMNEPVRIANLQLNAVPNAIRAASCYCLFTVMGVMALFAFIQQDDAQNKETIKYPALVISTIATVIISIIIQAILLPGTGFHIYAGIPLFGCFLATAFLSIKTHIDKHSALIHINRITIINIDHSRNRLPEWVAEVFIGAAIILIAITIPMLILYFPMRWLIQEMGSTAVGVCFLPVLAIYFSSKTIDRIDILYYKSNIYAELLASNGRGMESLITDWEEHKELKDEEGGWRLHRKGWRSFASLDSFVCTTPTYYGMLAFRHLSGEIDEKSTCWVLRQEGSHGGFSMIEGITPQLKATFLAIAALYETEQLYLLEYPDEHVNFVLGHQSEQGGFASTGMRRPSLEATYHAIASLNILEASIALDQQRCADWIFSEWQKTERRGKLNFQETYYLVYCLQWLNAFDSKAKDRILNQWLPMHQRAMLHMRPDTNYEKVYYYIKLLDLLGIREGDVTLESVAEVLRKKAI